MTGAALETYLRPIRKAFEQPDRRAAHRACVPILRDMGRDPGVLPDIIRKNLSQPGFLARSRVNPVLALSIEKNRDIDFIMHGWLPLPDRSTALTHQSIHHHGNLLLTSLAAFGPGYESILFKRGVRIDPATREATMAADRYYKNPPQNIESVDTDTPHVVFYPPAFSITYALWSTDKPASRLRELPALRKYKAQIKRVLEATGLSRRIGVNDSFDLDYYIENGKTFALKDRVMYPVGSHENFVQNLFHVLQSVGFADYDFVRALPEPTAAVAGWKAKFLAQTPIADVFDPVHLDIARINMPKRDLLAMFGLGDEPQLAAAA